MVQAVSNTRDLRQGLAEGVEAMRSFLKGDVARASPDRIMRLLVAEVRPQNLDTVQAPH